MCDCKKNQTHEDVFSFIESNNQNPFIDDNLGIGIFMIPAPEIGILEYKVIHVPNLSYKETVKRGENCKAFQWIPFGITMNGLNKSLVINSLEDFESLEINCNSSCRGGCPMNGCMCYSGEVYCKKR